MTSVPIRVYGQPKAAFNPTSILGATEPHSPRQLTSTLEPQSSSLPLTPIDDHQEHPHIISPSVKRIRTNQLESPLHKKLKSNPIPIHGDQLPDLDLPLLNPQDLPPSLPRPDSPISIPNTHPHHHDSSDAIPSDSHVEPVQEEKKRAKKKKLKVSPFSN